MDVPSLPHSTAGDITASPPLSQPSTPINAIAELSTEELIQGDLLTLMGAEHLTAAEQDELYQAALETIENRVVARIDELLTDEEAQEWKSIVEAQNKDKLKAFFASKQIDLPRLYAEETLLYKSQMIDLVQTLDANRHARETPANT